MMAAIHSPRPTVTQETGYPDGRSTASSQQRSAIKGPTCENMGSPPTSRVFEGMLRTTTETGDIGFFSIKPSGISHPVTGRRKIYHPPQSLLRHVDARDDRRNIPSPASSEILSMYDTGSQKSVSQNSASQDMNYPHYRSYSTTYSSSTLSNRRSYPSLTNQIGVNGPLQRPRSPFAYPSRMKRPPRSCFPVLVDGDGIGYPPRPDAESLIYEPDPGTPSPSSLHVRRQRPPTPSLRYSSNRSTPSLLGHASPLRRTPTPNQRHSSGPAIYGWKDTNDQVPVHVSPTRSNFSPTPTRDVQQDSPLRPVLNDATKDRRPTPSYYDYSEEFGSNSCANPEILEPPPQFHIGKTIPEDRQVSTDSHITEDWKYSAPERSFDQAFPTAHPPTVGFLAPLEGPQSVEGSKKDEVLPMFATAHIQRTPVDEAAGDPRYNIEEQPVLSQPSTTENIDHYKSLINGISQRQRSSNCDEPSLAPEDDDVEPESYDSSTSATFDHKSFAHDDLCNSSLSPTTALRDKINKGREKLGSFTAPQSALIDHESTEQDKEGHSRNNKINIDAIAIPDCCQHDASSSADQLRNNIKAHSEYPTATTGPVLGLPSLDTPFKFDSAVSPGPTLSHSEELLRQSSLPPPRHELILQAPTQFLNGSQYPSSYGSGESRLLSSQNTDIDDNDENPPKFRLKITRASDSILGTVRVNRTSADSKPLAGLHLRDPRDLFTPRSGIDDIFRQGNSHLPVPGRNSGSIHSIIEWEQTPVLASISNQSPDNGETGLNLNNKQQHLAAAAYPLNSSDVQSFFSDDSSHFDPNRNLRKRLSNLRARVAMPHTARNSAHSYDGAYENNWRNGIGVQPSNLLAARSADNLNGTNRRTGNSRPRRVRARIHARKVKEMVSGWFRGAKSVIIDHLKPGGLSDSGRREHKSPI